jgi:inorganic pyrophosphatase
LPFKTIHFIFFMATNIWHSIAPGEKAPEVVNAIIEITRGSKAKYELDKETGLILLDRVLSSPMSYPLNYGFIPQTFCDDGDPLDVLVFTQVDILPNVLVKVRVIGAMKMIDGGEGDDKILAVVEKDKSVEHIQKLEDVPQHTLNEIRVFFEDYKKLEKKTVEVAGFVNREEALKIVEESIELYKTTYGTKN